MLKCGKADVLALKFLLFNFILIFMSSYCTVIFDLCSCAGMDKRYRFGIRV